MSRHPVGLKPDPQGGSAIHDSTCGSAFRPTPFPRIGTNFVGLKPRLSVAEARPTATLRDPVGLKPDPQQRCGILSG